MDFITTLGMLVGILGGIPGVIFLLIEYRKRNKSWRQIKNYVKDIANQIEVSGFKPDVFLAFPKGGLIVADLLGHRFNNDMDIAAIFTKRTFDNEKKEIVYHIRTTYTELESLKGKNILIVDDVLENGKTLREVIALLERNEVNRNNIKSAILGRSIGVHPIIEPDFHAFDYSKSKGLHLPWGEVTL